MSRSPELDVLVPTGAKPLLAWVVDVEVGQAPRVPFLEPVVVDAETGGVVHLGPGSSSPVATAVNSTSIPNQPGAATLDRYQLVASTSSSPATPAITEYPIPPPVRGGLGITSGPDGNLWFTWNNGQNVAAPDLAGIGKITPAGTVTKYPLANEFPSAITPGPDRNLWFTGLSGRVGMITTSGVVREFQLPGLAAQAITTGPDANLWFTYGGSGRGIAKMTTHGRVTTYPFSGCAAAPGCGPPLGITAGPDGNLWVAEELPGKIAKISTSGSITEYAVAGEPGWITRGIDGNLWFTYSTQPGDGTGGIGKITSTGTVTEYPMPAGFPVAVAPGADGNLWFTQRSARVGKITTSGTVTEYALPHSHAPFGITPGPDGNLWFTDLSAPQIGKVTIEPPSPIAPASKPPADCYGINVSDIGSTLPLAGYCADALNSAGFTASTHSNASAFEAVAPSSRDAVFYAVGHSAADCPGSSAETGADWQTGASILMVGGDSTNVIPISNIPNPTFLMGPKDFSCIPFPPYQPSSLVSSWATDSVIGHAKLVVLQICLSLKPAFTNRRGDTLDSLGDEAHDAGAVIIVGFAEEIQFPGPAYTWARTFWSTLGAGVGVYSAAQYATETEVLSSPTWGNAVSQDGYTSLRILGASPDNTLQDILSGHP